MQFLPLYCFEIHPIAFYEKEKRTDKILSIYLRELDKKTRNYPPIKVRMKWSLDPFERFIARNTYFATFTSTLRNGAYTVIMVQNNTVVLLKRNIQCPILTLFTLLA